MQNGNQIVTIILLVVAVILALLLGSAIGSEDQKTPAIFIAAAIAITLALKLGPNAWVVLPIFWIWTGKIHVLPIPFTVRNLATFFVIGTLAISFAIGKTRFAGRLSLIDAMIFALAGSIGFGFILNPVGLSAMSSASVGARPYFEIGMALLMYVVLSNQNMTVGMAKILPKLAVISAFVLCAGKVIALKTPVGYSLWFLYSDWAPTIEGVFDAAASLQSVGRVSLFTEISGAVLLYLFAMGNPFAVLNPLRFVRSSSFILALLGIFVSGFRSILFLYGTAFMMATFIWAQFRGLMAGFVLAVLGIVALVAVNEIVPLPMAMQRSLSFLPGNWDELAKRDAEGSSEWRFEMWEQALFTDEVIKNRLLGDGFGFSSREIAILQNAQMGSSSSDYHTTFHDHMLLVGGFHSGPISTMRYVGYVGLAIYLALAITLSVFSYRTIREARGTPYYLAAMFFGLTWILYPLYFVAIFGSFDSDVPNLLLAAGILKLIRNSLRTYRRDQSPAPSQTPEPIADALPSPA